MTLPLNGVTVLDFSTLLPGPLATFMLAECGAEVIKIERPNGDDMRRFEPLAGDTSVLFATLHGGKKSVTADLKSESERTRLSDLIRKADVIVEQFRPGVMERLGLGYEAVRVINPRVIYCSISGYGQYGPRALEAGHDFNYQALSGLSSLNAGKPQTPAALAADIAGGTFPAVINILLALRQRDLTGAGTHLDIAMADVGFTFLWSVLAERAATGKAPDSGSGVLNGGSPRYQAYETADGRHVVCGALEQKFWESFCRAIELPEHLRDDAADPAATGAGVAARIRARTAAEWTPLLSGANCCATVMATLEEAVADPHFKGRGLFDFMVADPTGRPLPTVSLPIAQQLRADASLVRTIREPGADNLLLSRNPRP